MNKKIIKKIFPKRLLPRLLLIFLVPLIIIQCSVIFFFYDRHWEKIINRFSNIASNKINLILNQYETNGLATAEGIAKELNISLVLIEKKNGEIRRQSKLENKIHETIKSRVDKDIEISFDKNSISFFYIIDEVLLKIEFPRKYLLSETPTIYILWIISTSLILSLIALLFLRIQIRAIYRLAKSAEEFGEGKKIANFKPEGAMEIRAAGNAFIKMRTRINNYIDQKTSFLAGISHDLGTIITRIKLRLELIENQKEISEVKKDVETMQIFLKEYLEYSKENFVNKFSKVYLSEIIHQVVESSKLNNKVKIKCSKRIFINTDKNSLYRIIFNLFENATKYGQIVHITVTKDKNNIVIEIEDDGPGIENKFRKKVFKPFYKIDESRNLNKGGSGLGLSIANELAKKIRARISLKNSNNLHGSLFSIILSIKK